MLLETASTKNDGAQRRQPLIQVVNSSDEVKPKLLVDQNVVSTINEDMMNVHRPFRSASVPRLCQRRPTESSTSSSNNNPSSTVSVQQSTHTQSTTISNSAAQQQQSLAEQLLIDAKIAKQRRQEEQTKREHERAKKSTFGMKK